jgi:hypothetical protein
VETVPDGPEAAPRVEGSRARVPLPLVAAGAVVALAIVETLVAVTAPLRTPKTADWAAAERDVRAGFQAGDLIVAAPAWSDPVMRMHLGDLISIPTAGRMDAARFSRIWEIDQRGARSPETRDGRVVLERHHGALTVRQVQRSASTVSYDFLAHWNDAQVSRVDANGAALPCPWQNDRFQCPQLVTNYVRRQLLEIDTKLRWTLLAQPVDRARVVIEFPAVVLGREIVIATGLANVWMRKAAKGPVDLTVAIDGKPALHVTTVNESGWLMSHIDTAARAGQTAAVRFEVSAPASYARLFGFAAEARS